MLNPSRNDGAPAGPHGAGTMPLSGNWVAKLQRFASSQVERCELCGTVISSQHAHLLDVSSRRAVCACQGCATVVGARTDGRFRSMPARTQALPEFQITDAEWTSLQIPIELAFLMVAGPERRPMALYPSPAGATEALVNAEAWAVVVENNPALADLAPDVEALLVNRTKDRRDYFRVPIDRCFALVALFRKHWQGISGGDRVWEEIDGFIAQLREQDTLSRNFVHG